MKSNPTFSIITVCFNEKNGIAATCESVISQTYGAYEWIVVDGGSTDGTVDILASYHENMRVFISESDDGIYDAMNKGIEQASGDYLIFMNGGDRFSGPDVLATVAQAPAHDLIVGNMTGDGSDAFDRIAPNELALDFFMKSCLPHQSTYIAKSLFEQCGHYDTSYKIVADLEFFIRVFREAQPTYLKIDQILAYFDISGLTTHMKYKWKKKHEDHLVRYAYFPEYRRTLKCFRQVLRAVFRKHR